MKNAIFFRRFRIELQRVCYRVAKAIEENWSLEAKRDSVQGKLTRTIELARGRDLEDKRIPSNALTGSPGTAGLPQLELIDPDSSNGREYLLQTAKLILLKSV